MLGQISKKLGLFLVFFVVEIYTQISTQPIWVASSYFKTGAMTFAFSSSSATSETATISYDAAINYTSNKRTCLGITDLNYLIVSGRIMLQVQTVAYTSTYFQFRVNVNQNSYLKMLKLTYFILDASFAPPFSMNFNGNTIFQTSSNINNTGYVNFTSTTGVTLNMSHQNVAFICLHFIDITTYDNTIILDLDFGLANGSFYYIRTTSTSNMNINYAGFSRLIFDKTAIEAMGNDYFNYGIVESINNDNSALNIIIPPTIFPQNLYYGLHSFHIRTGLSTLNFTSSYNIVSGLIGFNSVGTYIYSLMRFSYLHHKRRTCPVSNPYYNISQVLCYNYCGIGWFENNSTMTCDQCLYDCYTCENATSCATCNTTVEFRQLNSASPQRCSPISGYYDNNTNSAAATPCTSPCATCQTTGTYCLSCISTYYLSSNQCLLCSSAIPNCTLCSNSSFCLQCNNGINGTSCTVCLVTQYKPSLFVCSNCSIISHCYSCTSATSCSLCISTFTLYSGTNCSCTSTQYISGSQCLQCSSAITYCKTCSSQTNCLTCLPTFNLVSPTVCSCSSTQFLSNNSCFACTTITSFCQTCTNYSCLTCFTGFIMSNGSCICPNGTYANASTSTCNSCPAAISYCIDCTSKTNCTLCQSGYIVNTTTFLCSLQPCQIAHCYQCQSTNYSICKDCDTGYSLFNNNTGCHAICGDKQLFVTTQQCDDGNLINGDGCGSTCQIQSGFSCIPTYVNVTQTYSDCYFSTAISISLVWILKIEGKNTLKLMFQIDKYINEWSKVNFTDILSINSVDTSTHFSIGIQAKMIKNYQAEYSNDINRFTVTIDYDTYDMQNQYISFEIDPYSGRQYPSFTVPFNTEFTPPLIQTLVQIIPNNNQNAKVYSSQIYAVYSLSVKITYSVLAIAGLSVVTSLIFRTGKVIVFQMLTVMQITYFSLAFLNQMNPTFSALLPLRYLAGILNFKNIEDYLQQTSSPNCMKGVYMFLNLSNNFIFVAISFGIFLMLGLLFYLLYIFCDWASNSSSLNQQSKTAEQRNGYCLYRLAFHFVGELNLSLIFYCLPLYMMSLFFEVIFTIGQGNFWSYSLGVALGAVILIYFVALTKEPYSPSKQFSKLGQYITEFNQHSAFKTLKYANLQMIVIAVNSGLSMMTIYGNNTEFATISLILISVVEIVVVAIIQPYRYGFVSCWKGDNNDSESILQKIQLYKDSTIKSEIADKQNQDQLKKTEQDDNSSAIFAQHFQPKQKDTKTKNQGLIKEGAILNHTKLLLFNNNFRKIINLITLIVVECIFACVSIYEAEINKNYDEINIQVALPIMIHCILFVNAIYNFTMIVLSIVNKTKSFKVSNVRTNQSDCKLAKSAAVFTPKQTFYDKKAHFETNLQSNLDIIKANSVAKSMYDKKMPQVIVPFRTRQNLRNHKIFPQNIYENND